MGHAVLGKLHEAGGKRGGSDAHGAHLGVAEPLGLHVGGVCSWNEAHLHHGGHPLGPWEHVEAGYEGAFIHALQERKPVPCRAT